MVDEVGAPGIFQAHVPKRPRRRCRLSGVDHSWGPRSLDRRSHGAMVIWVVLFVAFANHPLPQHIFINWDVLSGSMRSNMLKNHQKMVM